MNIKAGKILKDAIGVMYLLIGAGAGILMVYLVQEGRNNVYDDFLWLYPPVLTLLIAICLVQGYGLIRSRRWAYTLHTGLMIVWIPFVSIMSVTILQAIWRQKDFLWFLQIVAAVGLPIAIQWFLRNNRDRLLHPPGPTTWRVTFMVAGVVVLAMSIIVPVTIMSVAIHTYFLTSGQRQEIADIENECYRLTLYYSPNLIRGGYTQLIAVDKNSLLNAENRVWGKPEYKEYRLAFIDSNVVGMYGDDGDTIMIDLSSPPPLFEDAEHHPPWRTELHYEGCTDRIVAENDEFVVTWRSYPSLAGYYGGATRLLLTDRSSWFGRDKVLIEAFEEDAVEAAFLGDDTLRVVVHFLDPTHFQYRRHGGQDTQFFDLRNPRDYPLDY